MVEKVDTDKSAYDYIIHGKEPPPEVIEATLMRLEGLKTPHEQYRRLIIKGKSFYWPEDDAPSGFTGRKMDGGVPSK